MAPKSSNVEVLTKWSGENLSDGDKDALTKLTLDLEGKESDQAWQDPAIRKVVNESGARAVEAAMKTAEKETVDRKNEHWTANTESHDNK